MKNSTAGQGGLRLAREEREKQILDILSKRWEEYSTHGLARAVGLKPSPHFRGIVYGMVMKGMIEGYTTQKTNGMTVHYFYHTDRDNIHGQQRMGGF